MNALERNLFDDASPSISHCRAGKGYVVHHKHRTIGIALLCIWVVVFSLARLQDLIPLYQFLRMRESTTILLLFALMMGKYRRRQANLLVLYFSFLAYIFIIVMRSTSYSVSQMAHVYFRLVQYTLPLPAVLAFVQNWKEARFVLVFVVSVCVLGSLTTPLQEVTRPLFWLDPDWALQHGRAGFARYQSIFGDPNITAMIGGTLPLLLFALKTGGHQSRARRLFVELVIWSIGFILVAYSLSFTGILLFACSVVIMLSAQRKRFASILRAGIILLFILIVFPNGAKDRAVGTVRRFLQPAGFYAYYASGTHLESDVLWRLFEYWDLNDTVVKILFGSTYDLVAPASYINPLAILAHNGYKEMYLAGGLVGLGIFLALLLFAAWKALRLIRASSQLPEPLRGISLSGALIYLLLLGVMFGFPIYHYNGIGILFWCIAGLIHVLHDNPDWLTSAGQQY